MAKENFGKVLKSLMKDVYSGELARRTGIPPRTIENWQAELVQRPREVKDVLKIGKALTLDGSEIDRLLVSAGFPPTAQLQDYDNGSLRADLQFWAQPIRQIDEKADTFSDETGEQSVLGAWLRRYISPLLAG